jgi:hypothetical protein
MTINEKTKTMWDPQEKKLTEQYPLLIKHLISNETLVFKAMITQFEDQYSSEWNTEQVFGRMDPIRNFKGTQRIITLSWDVVAGSLEEAKKNLEDCGKLMAMLYPSYTNPDASQNAATISAAPLFQVRFANLIADASSAASNNDSSDSGLVGTIDGLIYAPAVEQDFFTAPGGHLYPQTVSLSFSLYVAHRHKLGWDADKKNELRIAGKRAFPWILGGKS